MTTQQLLPIATGTRSWAYLSNELNSRRGLAALTLLVSAVAAAMSLIPVYVFGILVDRVTEGAPTSTIVTVVVIITVAAIVGGVFTALGSYLISKLGEGMLATLRERVLSRALHLPVSTLERVGKGDLLSRVGDDVAVMAKSIGEVIPNIVSALLLVSLSVVAMLSLDWRLGLAGMVAIPMYVMALRWYLPRSAPLYAAERVAMGERSQALISSMQGARTVRAYGLEDAHLAEIDNASGKARDIGITVFRLFTRFGSRSNRAECVGLSVILAAGFLFVQDGYVTVGQVTAAALLFHRLFNPIGMLMFSFDDVQSAGASLARLVGVIDIPDDRSPGTGATPSDGTLEVSDLRHSYDTGHEVLHGIVLKVAAGETVALVGSTGAGKSTIAAIAAGSIASTSGTVRIGGETLADLGADGLRRHIAIVSQEVHVFAGRLIDDLLLAAPDASRNDVRAALETVGADRWVDALGDGLDTVVGEGGHALTSAQSQQLALARLVLADPAVAVLDEATAEAGSSGARDLEAAADAATRGRSTLVVAHRLTQAAAADRIVVLEHGTIIEQGPHDELVAAGGRYAELWSAWESAAARPVRG
ncbi:ABC transporter ATP-binding protein [Rhodococcus sp. BP-252]|uniref:ABC transporter ATP-binding protein n=1 Tax=unclassified Rhodococcus (in: high G+C Gram-positive bacteria) TaxID=192944 RepID=UPI001C9AECB9|nr:MULTISPECIES: ABC transporter ATP-binding protein [unclassified Rhodococcus (in: high G+C Gram-positive bacteria)]MBY6414677.1 ABC transporter ATP-binding protein [Rhodococcus sp. BP-320]MBY6419581.1 ABC transporter ATP-binding protein [Rhodococcus sp. BP-321]MBY6424585.1 ABC transporter ATP-binding protein [Rhodococcus sp. BP-324]MBY6429582.1 ABC transporter ATP-binding protein [Rhodococcus sp. BP-323]MBY6434554.1 ABC transporter ATP-binding protein [Rhodococcus sp. BP-322]